MTNCTVETRHPQVWIDVPGGPIEVDEGLAPYILHLNDCGYRTMFSCQGSRDYQHGYVVFHPDVTIEYYDRLFIEQVLGLKDKVFTVRWEHDDDIPDDLRYWSIPWDAREDYDGSNFGWALYFRYLP
jgi:hypothetical protein